MLRIIIVLMAACLMIYYYTNLFLKTKAAKLFLIMEVGLRAISAILLLYYGYFKSYVNLLDFVPVFLSISLYLSKGITAKILLGILISMTIILSVDSIIYY